MRYHVLGALLGLVGVPAVVSVVLGGVGMFDRGTVLLLVLGVLVGAAVAFAAAWWVTRWRDRPARWWVVLAPLVAPPMAYLGLWVVLQAVKGSPAPTLEVFLVPGLAYLGLALGVLFSGATVLVPVTLVSVLLGTLAGALLGARRSGRVAPHGRGGLLAVTASALVLALVAGSQVAPWVSSSVLLSRPADVGSEVPIWDYMPFDPENKLVVPDAPVSLTIADQFPKLDGATALYPVYGAIGQATYQAPTGSESSEDERWEFVRRYLDCSTTPQAYEGLIDGDVDAIFVLQPSANQLASAKEAGVELEITPIGREAFVFFVHADNPVEGLTLAQVRDIYARRVTNWREVGGADEPIIAFQRSDGSGSQTAMQRMVMVDDKLAEPLVEERISGMGGIISEVAGYRNVTGAIGYSFRWYATEMNPNPQLKLLPIDGVAPTTDNIRDGTYPLVGDFNIVTAGSTNPHVPELIAWTLSQEGQALVEKVGYVGVSR